MAHVVHFELSVPDPEQAAAFYREVFGWSVRKLADPVKYWQVKTSEATAPQGIPGGIVESRSGESRVSITVQVESMDAACAQVTRLGGRLITERLRVPGYGTHVLCKDPQGCYFALLEPLAEK